MSREIPPKRGILVGILRIARGRADGIGCFGSTSQAFLSSLAPLIAFPLVGTLLALFSEGPKRALTGLAMTLCALLTPAIVSYEMARIWKRTEVWIRFATAFNWCEWILPLLACVIMVPLSIAISMGLNEASASLILVGCLGLYGLWLHWFLARNALALSVLRAVMLVVIVNVGTVVAVLGPRFLVHDIG